MSKMYYGNINLSKIDKSKIYVGEKGKYLPIVVWINDELDKYGNIASVQQGQTKEESEAKVQKVYLGNLKTPASTPVPQPPTNDINDDGDEFPY